MTAPSLIFVEHEVTDPEGWNQFFVSTLAEASGKSTVEIAQSPVWAGNQCAMTFVSKAGDKACCFWNTPNPETFQAFIDGFTKGTSKNTIYPVTSSLGLQNMSNERYLKDFKTLADGAVPNGLPNGLPIDCDIYYVRHDVSDVDGWNAKFGQLVAALVGKHTNQDIQEAWNIAPAGCLAYLALGSPDKHACLWMAPKSLSQADFEAIVNKMIGPCADNAFMSIADGAMGIGTLHPDLYAQETLAMANSSDSGLAA